MTIRVVRVGVMVFAGAVALCAQGARPAFDVASVKRVVSPQRLNGSLAMPRLDRFMTTSTTLRLLIQSAYRRRLFENRYIVNGPSWIDEFDFDVNATIPEGAGTIETLYLPDGQGSPGLAFLMVRTLLEDRFKLVVHTETREMPVYALVLARTERPMGPRLVRSNVDCDAVLRERIAAVGKTGDFPALAKGQPFACSFSGPPGRLTGNDMSMEWLADALTSAVNRGAASPVPRPILDRTGLKGRFNLSLEWRPEDARGGAPGVSIYTALQEQLGLKLESTRAPVDVLVIDHVELPQAD